jgi:4-phosphopantoate--beta-alanine ligase
LNLKRFTIPEDHPRVGSLRIRELLVEGFRRGLVVEEGLIAHGRGEAFDYLIGERTTAPAREAIRAAAAYLLTAKRPVISVNGNVAALSARDVVRLSKLIPAPIEVNLFYRSREREEAIASHLRALGAEEVLGVGEAASAVIPELGSERRRVDPRGIFTADVVLVPLEDGDRTEALVRMGKVVIAVDLNPLSRTARCATVTIVDNVVRALPALLDQCAELRGSDREGLLEIIRGYDNRRVLRRSLELIWENLSRGCEGFG